MHPRKKIFPNLIFDDHNLLLKWYSTNPFHVKEIWLSFAKYENYYHQAFQCFKDQNYHSYV
jgi:hypothetical protein